MLATKIPGCFFKMRNAPRSTPEFPWNQLILEGAFELTCCHCGILSMRCGVFLGTCSVKDLVWFVAFPTGKTKNPLRAGGGPYVQLFVDMKLQTLFWILNLRGNRGYKWRLFWGMASHSILHLHQNPKASNSFCLLNTCGASYYLAIQKGCLKTIESVSYQKIGHNWG